MFKLFDSSWLTLVVYLLGVGVVLALGFEFNYILQILNHHEDVKTEVNNVEVVIQEAVNNDDNIEETTDNVEEEMIQETA